MYLSPRPSRRASLSPSSTASPSAVEDDGGATMRSGEKKSSLRQSPTTTTVANPQPKSPPAKQNRGRWKDSTATTTSKVVAADLDPSPKSRPNKQKKSRCHTKSIVAIILIIVVIASPFTAWELTIGRGYHNSDTFQFIQCGNDTSTTCCNGLTEICDLPVNEVLFAGVHNAHSSREDLFWKPNNKWRIEDALEAGYRAFLLDTCYCRYVGLVFCHGFCGGGMVEPHEIFGTISRFTLDNPTEVVILEFQMHRNEAGWLYMLNDGLITAGLGDMIHVHTKHFASNWATMKDLVQDNKRLVIFHHNGPHCWPLSKCPRGFHNLHWYFIETPYWIRGVDNLLNYNNSCSIAVGYNVTATFLLMNHFANSAVGLPEIKIAKKVNQMKVLKERIAACTELIGMSPNIVAVDFWSKGNLPAVTQEHNRMVAMEVLEDMSREEEDTRCSRRRGCAHTK